MIHKLIALLLLSITLAACSPSRKLAADFVNTASQEVAILLLPSTHVDMMYEKATNKAYMRGTKGFAAATLLPKLSDSIFLEAYYNSCIEQLEASHIRVFMPSQMTDFLNFRGKAYMVEVAQMDLLENPYQQEVEELHAGASRAKRIALRNLTLRVWVEVSAKDAEQSAKHLYFDEQSVRDHLQGDFVEDPIRQDAIFHYQIDSLQPQEVYEWAIGAGQQHAEYLYDLMMNTYVWNQLKESQQKQYIFLHYNPHYHVIERADEAFIMLED